MAANVSEYMGIAVAVLTISTTLIGLVFWVTMMYAKVTQISRTLISIHEQLQSFAQRLLEHDIRLTKLETRMESQLKKHKEQADE